MTIKYWIVDVECEDCLSFFEATHAAETGCKGRIESVCGSGPTPKPDYEGAVCL